ncbi:ligase-associated DNA damage response exonuclease [Dongia soli]|uniref:Ligase-associated DNA damage response exonuclease n=1 Tax=Dongia soli TaxID=600628 RepID=A0ABU5E9C8_9PROT|nr:ligase-associated DNA damage response exonuclease [Dongia soli]MDY0882946.1 ligase-associated DNA damage response exonuclease [Dongia soli]
MGLHPETWLKVTEIGLYCEPGNFYIDPSGPVDRAVITHGHSDHARAGHRTVLSTAETAAIMAVRYGNDFAGTTQISTYGVPVQIAEVRVTLLPAGHILGSAQVLLEYDGSRVVISGDYKRRPDRTCIAFDPVPCDVFITEATFGLPVFRHPPDHLEISRLLQSRELFPDRCHLIGVYALGKCQRVMTLLRSAGYDRPIYLHGALLALTKLYAARGIELGPFSVLAGLTAEQLKGEIVLCPPSALADRWSRRLPEPVSAAASGWMRVRARARQKGAELPLVISDHADWDELLQTVEDVNAPEVWITHGREDGLLHALAKSGRRARALSLIGREEEEEDS